MRRYKNKEEVLKRAKEAIGKTLGELGARDIIKNRKGIPGRTVESYMGCDNNNKPAPDIKNLGIEIKATAVYFSKKYNMYIAKYRLVCEYINYWLEAGKSFKDSSFLKKCGKLLIFQYEVRKGVPPEQYKIVSVIYWDLEKDIFEIIEKDYIVIQNKIMSGQAHNISEGDTVVLGACTKGSGKSYYTTQPFSDILAKRRAFCIKLQFMRELTRLIFSGELKNKNIIAFVDKECLARIREGRTA